MEEVQEKPCGDQAGSVREPDTPSEFLPPIDTRDIFRRLIADELRGGRLTPARRRRIVDYAVRMGLSAAEIEGLIENS